MNQKAFIFDMDGVIIDSETWWDKLYFQEAGHSLGRTIGVVFEEEKKTNPSLSWDKFYAHLDAKAKIIYARAPVTPGIDKLIAKLKKNSYGLGLVSGSPQSWIDVVTKRLAAPINLSISLQDRTDLRPKPAPDGYAEAMKKLKVKPENTLILEDTDMGITSAKSAGAKVICLTQFHPQNYHPQGADWYVKDIKELLVYLDSIQL
jgi:HAD superfamily hydrolase (TIGR01509 family)